MQNATVPTKTEKHSMSAFEPSGTGIAVRGWHYHPQEIVVRSASASSTLADDLLQILSKTREVGFVRHGAEVDVPASNASQRLDVNGKRSRYLRDGHLDLPLQRTLLADADLVVVDGSLDTCGPCVVELAPPNGEEQNLSLLGLGQGAVLFGERRPVQAVPPGGVLWFEPSELPELVEHLLEQLERRARERPLWALALLREPVDHPDSQAWLRSLSAHCERVLVASSDSVNGFDAAPDSHPGLADLGRILSCLEAHPSAAFLVADGPFSSNSEAAIEALLQGRDPLRVATALREPDTHLPQRLPSLWEPKSRLRIHPALAANIRCAQRILTHSRIQLLDPVPTT